MKKRALSFVALMLMAFAMVCSAVTPAQITGAWNMAVLDSDLAGLSVVLTFNADKSGSMAFDIDAYGNKVGTVNVPLKWDVKDDTLTYDVDREGTTMTLTPEMVALSGLSEVDKAAYEKQLAEQMVKEMPFGREENKIVSVTADTLVLSEGSETYNLTRVR